MDYIEREFDLVELFSNDDIAVFYGQPYGRANTDFYIHGVQNMVDYCVLNGIDSVFFHCSYAEPVQNCIPKIKEELERQYKTTVTGYVEGIWKIPHIDESFFESVLQNTLEQLEEEQGRVAGADIADDEPEVTKISVWAFHQGIRLVTIVHIGSKDDNDQTEQNKALHRKYRDILLEALSKRRKEAYDESKRIELEKQQVVLDELTRIISRDATVISLKTVKARNDYADHICTKWQLERGHSWLTKKAVRAIVELEYANQKI